MTPFERDIAAQGDALRLVAAHYGSEPGMSALRAAAALCAGAPAALFVGMGSSLSAAAPAVRRAARRLPAMAHEAGELLHHGLDGVPAGALVVLVSQSGRSVETVAVLERLRVAGSTRLLAVTNDPGSPLAGGVDAVLPILAGEEASVSTKTFMNSFAVLDLLGQAIGGSADATGTGQGPAALPSSADALDEVIAMPGLAADAAIAMAGCSALAVIARGPAHAAADYGALILKETAAIPAEAFAGGSFRHGPLEIAGPTVGIVMLAPAGPTRDLCVRMAVETSELGSPTWLIGDAPADLPSKTDRLRVTTLPAVDEAYSPLTMSVPIQRLAAALARARGRVPGELLRSRKVTDTE